MENPVYPAPIHIPYIPELDSLLESSDQEAIINMLDQNGERRTIGSLNWEKEYPYRPLAAVIAAHSGNALYLDFFVRCNYLRAENYEDQSPVSEDSCVEFLYRLLVTAIIGTLSSIVSVRRMRRTGMSARSLQGSPLKNWPG